MCGNLWAEVVLYEWDTVDIVLAEDDRPCFSSVYVLAGLNCTATTAASADQVPPSSGLWSIANREALTLYDLKQFLSAVRRPTSRARSGSRVPAPHRRHAALPNGILQDVDVPREAQPSFVLSIERKNSTLRRDYKTVLFKCMRAWSTWISTLSQRSTRCDGLK